jgi:hypothetical protein
VAVKASWANQRPEDPCHRNHLDVISPAPRYLIFPSTHYRWRSCLKTLRLPSMTCYIRLESDFLRVKSAKVCSQIAITLVLGRRGHWCTLFYFTSFPVILSTIFYR